MKTLENRADDWRQIAGAVRQAGFTGPITYQPNWDSAGDVGFWDALDVVTVSAYFPLTPTPEPTVGELKQAWHGSKVPGYGNADWFAQLQGLASSTGKRVLIGEVGYRSGTGAAAHPWDESVNEAVDQVTQANAYQALLETFSPQPWFMGVMWWQWRGNGGIDTDMSPKAKLAEQFLTQWWVNGWRPAPGSNTSFATDVAPGHGSSVPGARGQGAGAHSGTTGAAASTATSAAGTTQPTAGDPTTTGEGTFAAGPGTVDGGKSVANLARGSHGRGLAVGVAVVALFGMGAAWAGLGLRRLRLPHSLLSR